MGILLVVVVALDVVVLVLGFKGAAREKQIYQTYKGVFGKWSARLCVTFGLAGALFVIGALLLPIALIFDTSSDDFSALQIVGMILITLLTGAVLLLIAKNMYNKAKEKCPKKLRKDLMKNMVLAAFGSSLTSVFAFLPIFGGFLDNMVVTTGWDTSVTRGSELVDYNTNKVYRVSDIKNGVAYIEREGSSVAVTGSGNDFSDSMGNHYHSR